MQREICTYFLAPVTSTVMDTTTLLCDGQGPAPCANIVEKFMMLMAVLHVAVEMKKNC